MLTLTQIEKLYGLACVTKTAAACLAGLQQEMTTEQRERQQEITAQQVTFTADAWELATELGIPQSQIRNVVREAAIELVTEWNADSKAIHQRVVKNILAGAHAESLIELVQADLMARDTNATVIATGVRVKVILLDSSKLLYGRQATVRTLNGDQARMPLSALKLDAEQR